ncbi:MAG: hypothetical protein ACK5PF_04915, partial [bacterium]
LHPPPGEAPLPCHHTIRTNSHNTYKLGNSNTDCIYHSLWQQVKPHWDPVLSNKFLSHPHTIPQKVQTTALKYRTGTLHNQSKAHQYNPNIPTTCPLCPAVDSGAHIAGACQHPLMTKLYHTRHNAAGRLIYRAISKHSTKYKILTMDCGNPHKWNHSISHNRLSTFHITPPTGTSMTEHTAHLQSSKPDITLRHNGPNGKTHITRVEVKFCRDTDHGRSLMKAREQHSRLLKYLSNIGYTTTLCPILIGMSGTIYNIHTVQALKNLGLPGRACQKLCQKLHSTALTHLHSIVAQRRILENGESNPHPHTQQWSGPNSHTSYSRKKRKRSPD